MSGFGLTVWAYELTGSAAALASVLGPPVGVGPGS
jgi:hypothetical protein